MDQEKILCDQMMYLFSQNRHSFREARLCFVNESAPDKVGSTIADYLKEGAKNVSWFTAEVAEQAGKIVLSLPVGIVQGVKEAWGDIASLGKEKALALLNQLDAFSRDVPGVRMFFDRGLNIKNAETLRRLSDHSEWIRAFQDDAMGKNQDPNILNGKDEFGPAELLQSLSYNERNAIYAEYIQKFIPDAQLKTLVSEDSFSIRGDWKEDEMNKINATMGGILGMDNYEGQIKIADKNIVDEAIKGSLVDYYRLNDPQYTNALEKDYLQALRMQKFGNVSQIATNPAQMIRGIGPSRFRGALMSGAVNANDLQVLSSQIRDLTDLENESFANISRHLDRLSGESKEKAKQEAETLFAGFSKLGGFEKSLLIGLGAVLLWKSKGARWFAGTIAGAYFFQKLVLKSKDPVATWSNMLGAAVSPSKAAAADIVGAQNIPGLIDDSSMRAKTIMNFLDDYSLEYIERQTIGFTFLNDLPLSMLSRQFQIDEGGAFGLSVDSPAMKLAMREAASRHGWKNGAEQFFADPTNRAQAAEAMSYTFFLYAAQNPQNPQNATRSEKVMEALRALPSGAGLSTFVRIAEGNFDGIPEELRPQMIEAAAEFRSLILDGQVMAAGSTESLGAFMGRAVGYETFGLASDTASQAANNRRTNPGGAGGAGGAGGGNGGGGAPGGAGQEKPDEGNPNPGSKPDEGKTDPGSKPDEGKTDPGSKPDEGKTDPGSKPDEGKTDPGSKPDEGKTDPGSKPDEGKTDPGSKSDEGKTDPGSRPEKSKTEIGSKPDEGKRDPGSKRSSPL